MDSLLPQNCKAFICLISWDFIQKQYSSGPFKTVHVHVKIEFYGLSALLVRDSKDKGNDMTQRCWLNSTLSVIGRLITRRLWWIMASKNRPLGLPLLCDSREHLHYFKMLSAGLIWRMYYNLVQKAYFSHMQWTKTLSVSFCLHCKSGKSSVISMLMIDTKTCEDQDNWSTFSVPGDNK